MSDVVLRMDFPEIPESCSECRMPDGICSRRMLLWTRNGGRMNGCNSRHPDCPILAILPESHGRLIDAEAGVDEYILNSDGKTVINLRHTVESILGDYAGLIPTILSASAERREENAEKDQGQDDFPPMGL